MSYLGIYFSLKNDFFDIPTPENGEEYQKGDRLVLKFNEQLNDKIEIKEFIGRVLYVAEEQKLPPPCHISILRRVTVNDEQKIEANEERSAQALEYFKNKSLEYKLDMHPIRAQYSFDGGSIYLSFTAPERVDFRELVKDLATHFKKKIFLQQIGPRDRAQLTGGFGKCGRSLCCNSHLYHLPSVSMDAVRVQNLLYRNTSKLSGLCGKLLCCLNYEIEEYVRLEKNLPALGSTVKYKKETALVTGGDILNQLVKITLANGRYEMVAVKDVTVIAPPPAKSTPAPSAATEAQLHQLE